MKVLASVAYGTNPATALFFCFEDVGEGSRKLHVYTFRELLYLGLLHELSEASKKIKKEKKGVLAN